jgi:hypothetical protein
MGTNEAHPVIPGGPKPPRSGSRRRRDPGRALYRDALRAARLLKRVHRAFYDADPKAFRQSVHQAQGRIFRLKPGPKAKRDPRIALAARKRGSGAPWPDLYARFIDAYHGMTEFTRSLAEDGFRKKVNNYLRTHPHLRRRSSTTKDRQNPPA